MAGIGQRETARDVSGCHCDFRSGTAMGSERGFWVFLFYLSGLKMLFSALSVFEVRCCVCVEVDLIFCFCVRLCAVALLCVTWVSFLL